MCAASTFSHFVAESDEPRFLIALLPLQVHQQPRRAVSPLDAEPPINVLLVSTSYPRDMTDWRGLFIRHLVDALARRDDVRVSLWAPPGERPSRVSDATTPREREWLSQLMASGGIAHLMRRGGFAGQFAPLRLLAHLRRVFREDPPAAIRHVNWLQNALPLKRDATPLLATALGTDMALLKLPLVSAALRRNFAGRRVCLCPNAEWMVPELRRRFGDLAEVRYVPFGIAPEWFEVHRPSEAPPVARWLCVSRLTAGKLGSLLEWGAGLFGDGARELHLFGPMQEKISLPTWITYHGPTTPEALRERWFPQSTGLLSLSQHAEGRPQVMLEAMAAGVPIVASNIAAHSDLLEHGATGLLCETETSFRVALESLERFEKNRAIGEAAQRWARTHVGTWDDCAERYAKIYRHLLAGATG